MDSFDKSILSTLQHDADISIRDLGARVGLSHTPCWRRVRSLMRSGLIRKRVTLLDPEKLGLDVNVFVNVSLRLHQENALNRFEESVQSIPEVVECYSVSGSTDFLLRIVVPSVTAYELLLKETLVHLPEIGNLSSTFALRQVKYTTELPIGNG